MHLLPREKYEHVGMSGLSLEELFVLILGSGTKKMPVQMLARKVVRMLQDDLPRRDALLQISGIGKGKALLLEAVFEVGKRLFLKPDFSVRIISTPEDVLPFLKEYTHKKQEHLFCFYLNARQELIKKKVVTKGVLTMNLVQPREVFSEALTLGATGVIIAHNHPSGSLVPSDADYEVTRRLVEAGMLLGVELLDHVIFSKEGWRVL